MIILFSVLNAEPVYLNYYFGQTSFPLSILLALSFIIGSLTGVIACFGLILKLKRENTKMKKDLRLSVEEITNLRRLPLRDID